MSYQIKVSFSTPLKSCQPWGLSEILQLLFGLSGLVNDKPKAVTNLYLVDGRRLFLLPTEVKNGVFIGLWTCCIMLPG